MRKRRRDPKKVAEYNRTYLANLKKNKRTRKGKPPGYWKNYRLKKKQEQEIRTAYVQGLIDMAILAMR